ncbi:hypothetical protein RJ639_036545 [Escallonia herrerae]|uniref:Retrotransposon gag domain-containing protein n=1 Tax=Escallonia herrerae TaxID=1293975 RepID=A0AA88WMN2_9ASTE|nr:hypothetical protein RJ639_036545 [Escallonia herrerae]
MVRGEGTKGRGPKMEALRLKDWVALPFPRGRPRANPKANGPTTERERGAGNQGNNREMADEGTQRRNNSEFNVEGQDGITRRFVKLIKNPFFGKPDPTIAKEWLARAEKILDTARISNSQRLVYTTFMLEASTERWWKLLSMKWKWEGVPSTWENFKREFTNKYVPVVTQEKREVNFIKFEQQNMSVSVYESQFTDLARFCPHLVDIEERKVRKFVKGLNKDLRDKLIPLQLQTYMAVVDRALAIENDLEEQRMLIQSYLEYHHTVDRETIIVGM